MSIKELPHHHGDEHEIKRLSESLNHHNDDFGKVSEFFKLLSDPSRVRIFWLLCHHEDCVLDIASMVGMSSPAVSHHLKALRDYNLVSFRRVGKEVYYKATNTELSNLLHKIIEDMIDIACPEHDHNDCCCNHENHSSLDHSSEQIEIVHDIHDYLSHHLDQRITIEDLSHQFHMNPTTIKTVFKSVYGNSIAAHIKEHRMEQAARLLSDTDCSIAEVASAVGYGSQSKFTSAFKEFHGVLPTEFRKK